MALQQVCHKIKMTSVLKTSKTKNEEVSVKYVKCKYFLPYGQRASVIMIVVILWCYFFVLNKF